jgi:hypothetical protein
MSTLKVDTWENAAGTRTYAPVHTWVNFNGEGTVAIRDSLNVSSITDGGTGTYTVNFTTALSNANYTSLMSGGYRDTTLGIQSTSISAATGSVGIVTSSRGGTSTDAEDANVAIVGGI